MAGFFGLFNYSKPGPGVRKDEPKRSRFVQFFVLTQRKFWKLIQLNLLYILFCIPIVTIGPATSAMVYMLRQFATERPIFLFSDFWDAFKLNFKQSFIYSIIWALGMGIFGTAILFYWQNGVSNIWMYIPLGICIMILVLSTMANFYINLMIVTLDLKLTAIIKNGFLLSILCLKTNLISLLIYVVFWVLIVLFFPITLFVLLFLGFSFMRFVTVYNAYPGIKKYAIDPYLKSLEEGDEEDGSGKEEEADADDVVFQDEYEAEAKKEAFLKGRNDE